MLGKRDPKHYGSGTLQDLENACINKGIELGVKVQCFQSESESAIIKKLHNSMGVIDGIVLNAGAYTHYSIAIRDAIELIKIPVIEVHLSDIHNRESFRNTSVIEAVCVEQVCGMGVKGYLAAMEKLVEKYISIDSDVAEELTSDNDPLFEERAALNEIDKEMFVLFERRMKHVDRIAVIKALKGMPTQIPSREAEILEKVGQSVEEQYSDAAKALMQEILRLSRARQQEINKGM